MLTHYSPLRGWLPSVALGHQQNQTLTNIYLRERTCESQRESPRARSRARSRGRNRERERERDRERERERDRERERTWQIRIVSERADSLYVSEGGFGAYTVHERPVWAPDDADVMNADIPRCIDWSGHTLGCVDLKKWSVHVEGNKD